MDKMVEEIVCFLRNGRLIGLLAFLHLWIKVQSAAAPEDNMLSNDVISTGKSSGLFVSSQSVTNSSFRKMNANSEEERERERPRRSRRRGGRREIPGTCAVLRERREST